MFSAVGDKLPKPIKIFLFNAVFAVVFPIIKHFRYDTKKHLYKMPHNCRDSNLMVSLTSSPSRLKILPKVLENISKCVREIHINLPMKYRNKDPYDDLDIENLKKIDNVKIFLFDFDLGPIMKILPTLKRLLGTEYTILTIDDDSMYANSCFLNIPTNLSTGKITREFFDDTFDLPHGVETITYPMPQIKESFIKFLELLAANQDCKLHDDYCIGLAIKKENLKLELRPIRRFLCAEAVSDANALIYEDRTALTKKCNVFAKSLDTELR